MSTFQEDIRSAINRASRENGSDTPDFILAEYMLRCLDNFNSAVVRREEWYGRPCGFGASLGIAHESVSDRSGRDEGAGPTKEDGTHAERDPQGDAQEETPLTNT